MEKNELSCGQVAAIFCIVLVVAVFIWQMPPTAGASSVWATWVQAFGSIAAILSGVALINLEHKKTLARQRDAENESQRRLLKALATELAVEWNAYNHLAGYRVKEMAEGEPASQKWTVHPSPFPIYKTNAVNIGLIDDANLRRDVIKAYADFERLFLTYQAINLQIDETASFNMLIARRVPGAEALQEVARSKLGTLGKLQRSAYWRTYRSIQAVHAGVASVLKGDATGVAKLDDDSRNEGNPPR